MDNKINKRTKEFFEKLGRTAVNDTYPDDVLKFIPSETDFALIGIKCIKAFEEDIFKDNVSFDFWRAGHYKEYDEVNEIIKSAVRKKYEDRIVDMINDTLKEGRYTIDDTYPDMPCITLQPDDELKFVAFCFSDMNEDIDYVFNDGPAFSINNDDEFKPPTFYIVSRNRKSLNFYYALYDAKKDTELDLGKVKDTYDKIISEYKEKNNDEVERE